MPIARVALGLWLATLLAACSPGPDNNGGGEPLDLVGSWLLLRIDTPEDVALVADRPVTLVVSDEGAIGGSSACNSYFGSVVVDVDEVRFSDLGSTLIACPGAVGALESAYFSALRSVERGGLEGDLLTLTGPEVRLVLERQV